MRYLLALLLLTAHGTDNLTAFSSHVKTAGHRRGVTNIAVIRLDDGPTWSPGALAWAVYTPEYQRVFIRSSVLDKASPALIKYLAYHEVCHIHMTRIGRESTEANADTCAEGLFFSRNEWVRAITAFRYWRE